MTKNKLAIVTGANKGLGIEMVKELCAKYNGSVFLTSRDEKRGITACEELKKSGLNPHYLQLDVSNDESVSTFLSKVKESEIDILINNAGILFLQDAPEPRSFQAEETIKVNFLSLVNFTEAVLPFIQDGGKIVNISSSSGHLSRIPSESLRKQISSEKLTLEELKALMSSYVEAVKRDEDVSDTWGNSPYVVSKVGVNAYTFMLHRRLQSRGIKVNCVHPGYVMTDMTRGVGTVIASEAAALATKWALDPEDSGLYIWHDGRRVPWDGPDPRGYIDGIKA